MAGLGHGPGRRFSRHRPEWQRRRPFVRQERNINFANLSSSLAINGTVFTLVGSIQTLADDVAANPSAPMRLRRTMTLRQTGLTQAPRWHLFVGSFNGLGNTITHLSIDDPNVDDSVGLFAQLGTGGTIASIRLSHYSIQGQAGANGGVAGTSDGSVFNSFAVGSISTN